MKIFPKALSGLIFYLFFFTTLAAQCDRQQDSLALVELYNSTNGIEWDSTWNLSSPIDFWFGVCLNDEGCIVSLDLDGTFNCQEESGFAGNNLVGSLPDLNLPNLQRLELYGNDIGGVIPDFTNMPDLEYINLALNEFTSIPNFSNLPKLEYLYIHNNQLNLTPDFSNLPNLIALTLSNNILTTIPSFSNLINLETLSANNNDIEGEIPDLNLPNLKTLSLEHNNFDVAPNFTNLPNLEYLNLSYNGLTSIPDFSNLPNLDRLSLNFNEILILPNFSNLPNLTTLEIQFNELTGNIPDFSNSPNLGHLSLLGNNLTGTIPTFTNLSQLTNLELGNNNLSGIIPDFSIICPNLYIIGLASNQFTFEDIIPYLANNEDLVDENGPFFSSFSYAFQQNFYPDTALTGFSSYPFYIDLFIDDTLSTNTYIWYKNDLVHDTVIGSNKLKFEQLSQSDAGIYRVEITNPLADDLILYSGNISLNVNNAFSCRLIDSLSLVDLYYSTNGVSWDNTWDLTQPIDTWYGVELNGNGCVSCLDMDGIFDCGQSSGFGNNLSGNFPVMYLSQLKELYMRSNNLSSLSSFDNLINLEVIHFQNNELSGNIPEFNGLTELEELRLSNNDLSGSIPNFNSLTKLKELYLQDNQLSGNIPPFTNQSELIRLFLRSNDLSGNIPDFPNLNNLIILELASNNLSGDIPNFSGLANLLSLYLRNNQLSGSIPEFNNFPNLQTLNLDNNDLIGNIPEFNNLINLESLNLGNNDLIGNIPEFNNLINLESLNLGNNELTGSIPNFNHLTSLKRLTLSGNQISSNISELGTFENLENFYLSKNMLVGLIPDFSTISPAIKDIELSENHFTFQDILPNLATNLQTVNTGDPYDSHFSYHSQADISNDTLINIVEGNDLILNLFIDDTVSTNIYIWYRYNERIDTIYGSNSFMIQNIQLEDAAKYSVRITNPEVPFLTLYSGDFEIEVDVASSIEKINQNITRISPNPFRDFLQIELPDNQQENVDCYIYDVFGRLVKQTQLQSSSLVKVPTENLSKGIYWVNLQIDDQLFQQRVVKQ